MSPKDWLNCFLESKGLANADGRPLYRYRLTEQEYKTLLKSIETPALLISIEELFKRSKSSHLRSGFSITWYWSAAFVLYAAEWWRREYDGGNPKWENLFASLVGIQANKLPSNQRSLIVEIGLRYWRREVRVINGSSRYLGTIATEGGLPLNQLKNTKNDWLSQVFKRVIPKYSRLQHTGIDAAELIAECEFIPKTYRSYKENHAILGDMVTTVVKLKREHQLHLRANPIIHLDQAVPAWRNDFPLPIEDEIGLKLLSDMIFTAAKADSTLARPMRCIRSLGEGSVQLQLEFAGFIALEDLKFTEPENIPNRLELELVSTDGKTRPLGIALKTDFKNEPSLKMPRPPAPINSEAALLGYLIRFKQLGETLKEIPLIGGEALANDVPWVFVQRDENWELAGLASVSTRAQQVRVLYPVNWVSEHVDGNDLPSALPHKKLLEASGTIRISDSEGNAFTIKTAAAQASNYYYLEGKGLGFASNPNETYLGIPTLRCADSETGSSKTIATANLIARPVNSKGNWQPLSPSLQGIYEIRLVEQGTIVFRKKCVLLPETFAVLFKPSEKTLDGTIFLDHIGNAEVICETVIRHNISRNDDAYRLELFADETPPSQIRATLRWQGMTDMLTLTLPYPARGGQVIGADGNKQEPNQPLYQDQLHGIRLRLFNENPDHKRHLQIDFTLVDSSLDDLRDLRFFAKLEKTGAVIELAVIDYLDWIKTLLAVSGNLDGYVQLAVYEHASELMRIKIHRYPLTLERNLEQGHAELAGNPRLSLEELDGITLMAMRLSQPEQEPISLDAKRSGHALVGSWQFHPEMRPAEPWLIYPAKTSSVPLRPLLWAVGYEPGEDYHPDADPTNLADAVMVGQTEARKTAIKQCLANMSRDFAHNGWDYLQQLWGHCPHLPLSSFDVWAIAVSEPQVLAALVLQMDTGFIEKLNAELPVFWELLPLADWLAVYSAYQGHLRQIGIDEADLSAFMAKRIDKITAACPTLEVVARIIKQSLCNLPDPELGFMRQPVYEWLIGEVKNARQEPDQRQADGDWPTVLKPELLAHWRQLAPAQQFGLQLKNIPENHHAAIILPIVLAANCANADQPQTEFSTATSIFKLKCLKSFDEDWFNTVFKWALAYLSQQSE